MDEADQAISQSDWAAVRDRAQNVLALDPDNSDANAFIAAADRAQGSASPPPASRSSTLAPAAVTPPVPAAPTSFSNGRYEVTKFLGEGGKKKVYLAHDTMLDREVAFALIKTEGLDEVGMIRVNREAQAMGRLGSHPHIVTVFDLGQENDQPFMVTELMGGGDVEGLVEDSLENRVPMEQAMEIGRAVCRGLEFAHSRNIVHRDLKPGNVWLTSDGIAKIGDFGLAVATDRSRLTTEGMMVGTVSYMPPEQAMGGEVTPKADLYSLGAMMYEMVTGRPPFLGDDAIAIIGQHINTPPVSPTWHNSACPRALEALILRLLAKNPEERPDSASDVLTVLDGVGTEVSVEQPAVASDGASSVNTLDSVAQGVFVGRQQEMGELKAALEDSLSGRGRMVTLVGEPGVGKTRTSQELATYAGLRGCQVLWGRCYEEQGVPPYWPWVQAIRSYVRERDPQELSAEMGAGAADISEVVSDVKTRLPGLQPTPQLEPEQARFRLFDSITAFLKSASQSRPLMIVLDDLHWADKPSLLLLQFVARELSNGRILLVGTYRDAELSRQHPLAESLGDLTRERAFQRVQLRGLTQEDVGRFIEVAAGVQPGAGLVNAVYNQTEGNPLFVTEVVRLLVQEGQLGQAHRTSGRQTESWNVRIPEGVREVIGRRLNRLSERCNETLTIASIVGREFAFGQLKALVDDISEDRLLDVLEEALAARVIEELPDSIGRYQFTHALLQETLVDELSLTRRIRLHGRIAESLEDTYGEDADAHAPELAFHFEQAQGILGTEKLLRYSVVAGKRALAAWAFDEARDYFDLARGSLNESSDDLLRAEVEFGYGRARSGNPEEGDYQACFDLMRNAFDMFRRLGANGQAVTVATELPFQTVQFVVGADEMVASALEIVEEGTRGHALLLAMHAFLMPQDAERADEVESALDKAVELSARLGEKGIQAHVLVVRAHRSVAELDFETALSTSDEALELARQVGDFRTISLSLDAASRVLYATSDIDRMSRLQDLRKELIPSGVRIFMPLLLALPVPFNWYQGRSKEVNEWFVWARENGVGYAQTMEAIYFLELGETEKGHEQLRNVINYTATEGNPVLGHFALGMAWAASLSGEADYTEQAKSLLPRVRENIHGELDTVALPMAKALIAANGGDAALAAETYQGLAHLPTMVSIGCPLVTSRIGGLAARTAGLVKEAENEFQRSIAFCESKGMLPELAWSCSDLAELLVANDGDHARAQELDEQALDIANSIGMKPLIRRILSRREILKA